MPTISITGLSGENPAARDEALSVPAAPSGTAARRQSLQDLPPQRTAMVRDPAPERLHAT